MDITMLFVGNGETYFNINDDPRCRLLPVWKGRISRINSNAPKLKAAKLR